MGILNATPDSFSGDGLGTDHGALLERARRQLADGAAILDVGGESTRPGAESVGPATELARAIPLVEALRVVTIPISIDTSRAVVAEAALRAGAVIVNDVSGFADPELPRVAAEYGAWLVAMHNGWTRKDQGAGDVVERVSAVLAALVADAMRAGVAPDRVIVDPGIGFGKTTAESLTLVRRLGELRARFPRNRLLVGPSRKRFIGETLGLDVGERLEGTLAIVSLAVAAGADIVRVHDVAAAVRAARMASAVVTDAGSTRRIVRDP
jgi:dihydropteroate synthase